MRADQESKHRSVFSGLDKTLWDGVQDDGEGRHELAGGRELLALIDLLPKGQISILVLIGVKGCPHQPVKEEKCHLAIECDGSAYIITLCTML